MRDTSIYFDEAVEVAKHDGEREEDNVKWLSSEQTDQLDDLDPHHEDTLSPHSVVITIPR